MSGGDLPQAKAWLKRLSPGTILRRLLARRGTIEAPLYGEDAACLLIISDTRKRAPLLLNDAAALHIILCVRAAARTGAAMAEAGVLMGGSARLICEAKGNASLHLFDVFETLQREGSAGLELRQHFKTVHGQLASVRALLTDYANVHFHPGIFPETAALPEDQRFGFVHLDLDLESSTAAALEYFYPRLVPGGILVGDDYDDPIIRNLFRRFFAETKVALIELPWGQAMVVKVAS